ncbi:MAG: alpha/beta hydrolase [Steroidobacteraceae bacterium]
MSILRWLFASLVVALVFASAVYLRDLHRAYDRIANKSKVIPSPYGDIEFVEGGAGTPVLVIHGSGGGFDQGELIAQAVLGSNFHWIAPSRFGYLRSTFHGGATFDDQAHAYAHLLDRLGLSKVAVVALSHGGPSALLFAVLYPERVSSLTLLSCGVASSADADQASANQKGSALTTIFKYDPLYWGVSTLMRRQLMGLMGASGEVIATLTPEQRKLMDEVIDDMNPVAPRSAGVTFDNQAVMPNERIAKITAPTLIFHATDDSLQLYRNAEFAAATIQGARLKSYARGGHLLIAVEQDEIRRETRQFIRTNSGT